ncbi:hypothetical protein BC360_24670 [Ensifer sp. LC163]|nr:hypothetical protein BC361_00290 [Ensifer sp. LC54]OCP36298.1 hypothetical protein BC360_24670 [Ensifer sp. LC163]
MERVARASLPALSTGFINAIAVGLIIPIIWLIAPLGVAAAHAMDRRQLEADSAFSKFWLMYGFYTSYACKSFLYRRF